MQGTANENAVSLRRICKHGLAMYVCEKGLAFLISHLTRQRHFSGPLFIVRGHAMTWAGSGRDLGLSEVTATCIWRNIRLARLFF